MSKHKHIRRISVEESKYFTGEMMTCAICGKQQRSNPKKSSQWTVIEANGKPMYVCPKCFGNEGLK